MGLLVGLMSDAVDGDENWTIMLSRWFRIVFKLGEATGMAERVDDELVRRGEGLPTCVPFLFLVDGEGFEGVLSTVSAVQRTRLREGVPPLVEVELFKFDLVFCGVDGAETAGVRFMIMKGSSVMGADEGHPAHLAILERVSGSIIPLKLVLGLTFSLSRVGVEGSSLRRIRQSQSNNGPFKPAYFCLT